MDTEIHRKELNHAPEHEDWLHCYRLALEFGPVAANALIQTLDKPEPALPLQHDA